mmetsp:Transcript_3362/g.9387  ORF Transcript_3362/g.9387 Transcript_3362/m.9387 type:complete len:281 (-) Transcript_3362:100-942(-)
MQAGELCVQRHKVCRAERGGKLRQHRGKVVACHMLLLWLLLRGLRLLLRLLLLLRRRRLLCRLLLLLPLHGSRLSRCFLVLCLCVAAVSTCTCTAAAWAGRVHRHAPYTARNDSQTASCRHAQSALAAATCCRRHGCRWLPSMRRHGAAMHPRWMQRRYRATMRLPCTAMHRHAPPVPCGDGCMAPCWWHGRCTMLEMPCACHELRAVRPSCYAAVLPCLEHVRSAGAAHPRGTCLHRRLRRTRRRPSAVATCAPHGSQPTPRTPPPRIGGRGRGLELWM